MTEDLADRLHADLTERAENVVRSDDGRVWLLVGASAGRTVEVHLDGDSARLHVDRIVHALSAIDADEVEHVADVAAALSRGDATLYFGSRPDGPLCFLGYEIRGEGYSYRRIDEGVTIRASVPL